MSDRSFTIDSILKNGRKVKYSGGRFISKTPSGAAKKMFTKACQLNKSGKKGTACSLIVNLHETTSGSRKKEYSYRVNKIYNPVEVNIGGDLVTFRHTIRTKSKN